MTILIIMAYIAIGLLSGILSGLLGLGGGIVIVPALVFIFSWQDFPKELYIHMATGTSLAVVMFTTAMAAWSQHKRNSVAWDLIPYLVPGMVLGAILGVISGKYMSAHALRYTFALFCFVLALKLIFAQGESVKVKRVSYSKQILILIGLLAGALSGMLGIGGGSILIPILMWLGLSMTSVSGTAVACAFPTAVTGTIISILVSLHSTALPPYSTGYIYWPAVFILAIISMLAAPVGVALAHRLPEKIVKRIFGVVLVFIAWKMAL